MPRLTNRTMTVSDDVVVDALPQDVWEFVADPTRTAEYSPENTGAATPHPGPLAVGERFVGTNKRGAIRWATGCKVTASEAGKVFAFTVDRYGIEAVRFPTPIASWSYTFDEVEGSRTRVTETWTDDRRLWPDAVALRFDKLATGGRTFAEFQRRNIRRSLDKLATLFADA